MRLEPRFKRTKSGFVKSRHIDDKAMVAAAIEVLRQLKEENLNWFKSQGQISDSSY